MFSENVKPGDHVLFIESISGRTLAHMTLRALEFTEHGQFIRVDTTLGAEQKPVHEFRINPHRQLSFPSRPGGVDIGCVEFYDPQIDLGVCSVPIVIHANDGVSIHVEHVDAPAAQMH